MADFDLKPSPRKRARRERDAYYTPPEYVAGLLHFFGAELATFDLLGEPFAGEGHIANPLRAAGHEVIATDITDGFDVFGTAANELYAGLDAQVTNPPYGNAPACIRRLRQWSPFVAALLRDSFAEPCKTGASARVDLVQSIAERITLPRRSFTRDGQSDNVTYSWFIWRAGHIGPYAGRVLSDRDLAELQGQQTLFTKGTK